MKKTYQKPATAIVRVATNRMVCTSPRQMQIVSNETVSDINDLQSRQGGSSLWDDDED